MLPNRVLIVLLGAVGDVTRALPLLCRLKKASPPTEIFWAVEPASAALLHNHPALKGVLVFDRPGGLPAFARLVREVRRIRADLTLDLQRHLKSGIVTIASGAPRRIGFHRQNSREGNFLFQTEHIPPQEHFSSKLRQFLCFADALGVPEAAVEFGLRLSAAEEGEVEAMLAGVARPFAAISVGSTAESRLWFPERTAAVVDALAERGVGTVLIGGPGEQKYAAPVAGAARAPVSDLVGKTTLRHVIGILARAALVLGPDSGPMHIAAAVGTPVVSLWGATSARRSAPWGSERLVIEGVAACSPCYRKTCPIGRVCMQSIGVEPVMERIGEVLARRGG